MQLLLVCMDSHLDFYTCRISIRVEAALLTSIYKRLLHAESARSPELVIVRRSPYTRTTGRSTAEEKKKKATEATTSTTPLYPEREDKKGAIFNIVFVDIPSIAEMVMASVDLLLLPLRIGLAALLLATQVRRRCMQMNASFLFLLLLFFFSIFSCNK